jgi:hypothetical protein
MPLIRRVAADPGRPAADGVGIVSRFVTQEGDESMKRLWAGLATLALAALTQVPALGDDAEIAKQIISRLKTQQQSANLKNFDIGVQVDRGTVTMMGQVADANQAVLALDVARRTAGVKLVVNDLYVMQKVPVQATPAAQVSFSEQLAPPSASAPAPSPQVAKVGSHHQAALAASQVTAPPAPAAVSPASLPESIPVAARRATGLPARASMPAAQPAARRAVHQMPVAYAPASNIAQVSATTGCVGCGPAGGAYVDGGYAGEYVEGSYDGGYVDGSYAGEYMPGAHAGGFPDGAMIPHGAATGGQFGASFDNPVMPGYSWPSYSAYPNYGSVTYPRQYSATAWPYIGPFYPYPQVPLGWRKVMLEWDDGWWFLDFRAK